MAGDQVATRFVGIDWAAEEHEACLLDATGTKVSAFTIAHTREGFDKAVAKLASFGAPAETLVAIERPDGRLVDRLLQ